MWKRVVLGLVLLLGLLVSGSAQAEPSVNTLDVEFTGNTQTIIRVYLQENYTGKLYRGEALLHTFGGDSAASPMGRSSWESGSNTG